MNRTKKPMRRFVIFLTGFLFVSISICAMPLLGGVMRLSSAVFVDGKTFPKEYTCDGNDVSPPLSWNNAPSHTKSFVLIVDDPDAPRGTWDHWIVFNIPSHVNQLKENISALPEGTKVGKNSWGNTNYGGPCPPSGVHRYFFTLYALDVALPLHQAATKHQVIAAMKNHVIAEAQLMGTYKRER